MNPATYSTNNNLQTGKKTPVDMTIETANKEIEKFTSESQTKYLLSLVIGEFTLQDAIEQELRFHGQIKSNCESLGFGNSVRVATHCIKVLKKLEKVYAFTQSETKNTDKQPKLSVKQIALKYVYEGKQITRNNANDIATKHKHKSGEYLFQEYTYYSNRTNRIECPDTKKKLQNKIQLIKSVIELFPPDKLKQAMDEVSILKNRFETEYQ